jgi:hypothetical protein
MIEAYTNRRRCLECSHDVDVERLITFCALLPIPNPCSTATFLAFFDLLQNLIAKSWLFLSEARYKLLSWLSEYQRDLI